MPRIPTSNKPQDATTVAQAVEREEVAQAQEENQAALASETSFYAGEVLSDAALRPHLRALRLEVPQLRNLYAPEVVRQGYSPSVLQGADLTVLREAYAWFHDHLPQTALAHDLELAWAGGVERHLDRVRRSLDKITAQASPLAVRQSAPQAFFAAWDKECAALRQTSNTQLEAAKGHAPMGPQESFFYQQLLDALDEFAQPIEVAKAKKEAPNAQMLTALVERLKQVAAFSKVETYL